jgi:ATP-binding cassette subfamily B protein
VSEHSSSKSIFSVALKSIAFAWRTDKTLFVLLIVLNIFMGGSVYLQFTSFSAIVDEIILIKTGQSTLEELMRLSIILGLSFLIPTLVGNVVVITGTSFE